ncbi:hypothetical protein EVAR_98796_1 [Eumeta japonica]|uniref:Uncharacterized protein n=1 Tax=Eumeta variegata TaxID=151549 RepID=A0A4C1XW36_EUMVA|nr:hypothetical protein EVAR_98796_1 [Eumeta japonica]
MSVDGLDCIGSTKKTEHLSIRHSNENAVMPESVTSVLHAVINNENEIVIYSDELGIGLAPMLSGYMNHRAYKEFLLKACPVDLTWRNVPSTHLQMRLQMSLRKRPSTCRPGELLVCGRYLTSADASAANPFLVGFWHSTKGFNTSARRLSTRLTTHQQAQPEEGNASKVQPSNFPLEPKNDNDADVHPTPPNNPSIQCKNVAL